MSVVQIVYTVNLQELIDTLWNVNFSGSVFNANVLVELIDTLWNVNLYD